MSIKTFFFFGLALISFAQISVASTDSVTFYDSQIAPGLTRAQDSSSYKILGFGVTSILLASTQDDITRDRWKNNQQIESRNSSYGDRFGTYGVSFFIVGGQWFLDRENSKAHLRALVAVTVIGTSIKVVSNRERPNKANRLSFPSGHTFGAFATATSLSYAYGWKAAAVMFPVATFVGLSRISDDDHWLSDVVAGAVLGVYCGRLTYFGATNGSAKESMWLPLLERDRAGVQWLAQF